MLLVIFKVIRKDKDVVNIGYIEDIKERTEDFVNPGLKSSRSISETKGHNKCFKKAIAGIKCRYLFLTFFDLYLVKGINNVELSVELGCAKLRQSLLEEGEGVAVLDYDYI
jgi:hypothetical protein